MEHLHPDKRMGFCWSAYALAVAIAPIAASVLLFRWSLRWALIFAAVLGVTLFFLLVVYFPWRCRSIRYCINENSITVESGVFFKSLRRMPLSSVRYVIALRGPLERIFGLSSLLVFATGGRVLIEGIPCETADTLLRRLVCAS